MPSRPIPPRPSLEFDRKQAKTLLDELRRGEPGAARRFRDHHPRFGPGGRAGGAALHDAQLVVAREYGFASWPRWKQFVEARQLDTRGRAAALARAACAGDMRRAAMLLDAEPELERHDLYTACACGVAEHVARALARDPALAARPGGPLDREPILYACFSRFLRSDAHRAAGIVRVARLLLDHGADANAHYAADDPGESRIQTALYGASGIANSAELTRMLLAAGADVNELAGEPAPGVLAEVLGPEALYHASEFADVTCLRLLLEANPPPHQRRVTYCLARMLDFENPAGVALYLDHGADPNFRIPWLRDRTHLHRAVAYGRGPEIVRRLLEAGGDPNVTDDRGMTPLRSALRYGRQDLAALLREAGADVTKVTDEDVPGFDPDVLCDAAGRGDVELLRRLLEAGADPNALGGVDEMPALHAACWRGQLRAARLLIERGADVHTVNRFGGDALDTAMHGSVNCHDPLGGITTKLPQEITHGNYPGIAEMLLGAGARLPPRIGGSEAVQEVLRSAGVPDPD